MPIILAGFCLLPFVIAMIIEYLICLKSRRWYLRAIPPVAVLAAAALSGWGRYRVWSSASMAPWTQLLFFPGLPALAALLGMLVAWRLWHRRWRARVVDDKKK